MNEPATRPMNTKDGPLVVLDRCVLTYGRVERIVGPNAQFVLPDTFFYEAATADPASEGPKFNAWAKRFADRLFLSTYWNDLSRQETEPGIYVDRRLVIHEGTEAFRQVARRGDLDWTFTGETHTADVERREGLVSQFVQHCQAVADGARAMYPDWGRRMRSLESQIELIRQPGFVAGFVQSANESKRGPEWLDALSVFPDRHAAGRWIRLVAWYAIQFSLGKTKDVRNNYHDAEYAFAASYVGRIATNDNGLKSAVRAVFPDVEILSDS